MTATSNESPHFQRALALHRKHVVADLHVDTLLAHDLLGYDMTKRHRCPLPFSPLVGHADIPRARDAGLSIWGLGLVCSPRPRPDVRFARIRRQMDYLHRVCEQRPKDIAVIRGRRSMNDILSSNRIGAFCGIEGAHAVSGSLDRLREAHDMGVRYFTLAHFSDNEAASCAFGWGSRTRRRDGLTDFGRRLVDEVQRMGMVLDLAHVNKAGFMEACTRSERPVIVSHTGISGVKRSWRNIDDEQIEAVARTGGVVGVIFGPQFLARSPFASLDAVVAHILHVVRVTGADHVAYGSDMDGWLTTMPRGFADMADLPKVTALLLDAGLPEADVVKIMGGNVKRVLEALF